MADTRSGGVGGKDGEVWSPATNRWRVLRNVRGDAAADPSVPVYPGDTHHWLFAGTNGLVFHAVPSTEMHWIGTQGDGSPRSVGRRGNVLFGGGGLCGGADHINFEIMTPPYLHDAQGWLANRPGSTHAPASAAVGGTLGVTTDRAVTIQRLSNLRAPHLALLLALTGAGPAGAEPLRAAHPAGAATLLADQFRLQDPAGRTVDSDTLVDRPYGLFLGFTHCPDVCPTTLAQLRLALRALPDPDLRIHFITIDPERDTPTVLADYMQSFDPRIVTLLPALTARLAPPARAPR